MICYNRAQTQFSAQIASLELITAYVELTAQFLIPVPHFNLNRDFVIMVSYKEYERAMSLKFYLEIELIRRLIGGSNEQKVTLTHILVVCFGGEQSIAKDYYLSVIGIVRAKVKESQTK